MTKTENRYQEYIKAMYPNVPAHAVPGMPKYLKSCKKTNDLTKAIIHYCKLKGWQAERVSSSGRVINKQRQVKNILGQTRTIGSSTYIPPTSQNGTADISTTIGGRSIKIEVKNKATKDKMSESQQKYKAMIEATGGIYFIAETLDQAIEFLDTYPDNPNKIQFWKLTK